jgi:transposase-like protein
MGDYVYESCLRQPFRVKWNMKERKVNSVFDAPHFHDEGRAREFLESLRWPGGRPVCPHCGNKKKAYALKGKTTRAGLYKCGECRKPFTVTVGTLFERSKIPLHKWLQATQFVGCSKTEVSALQIQRMLGLTYKSAWFNLRRIRETIAKPVKVKPKRTSPRPPPKHGSPIPLKVAVRRMLKAHPKPKTGKPKNR